MFRFILTAAAVLLLGCTKAHPRATPPAAVGLGDTVDRPDLAAAVRPPVAWVAQPVETGFNFTQQTWISPAGGTAYGVIRFSLPFPVSHDMALRGFLDNMRRSEGTADVLERVWDEPNNRLRFVARGGRYVVRTNLFVRGFRGWAVFAGTRTDRPVDQTALPLAEAAREQTTIDR